MENSCALCRWWDMKHDRKQTTFTEIHLCLIDPQIVVRKTITRDKSELNIAATCIKGCSRYEMMQ